jgi:protein SCO1/2
MGRTSTPSSASSASGSVAEGATSPIPAPAADGNRRFGSCDYKGVASTDELLEARHGPRVAPVAAGVAAFAVVLAVAALVATVRQGRDRAGRPGPFAGVTVTPPAPKPAFTLTDTAGRPFDFIRDTAGSVALLYFGYTHCPDICPVHMAQIAAVLRRQPELGERVKVVFVTVDPDRDDPTALRSWLDHFDRRFVGLTGTPDQLAAAQAAVGVPPAVKQGDGRDYGVGHAAQVFAYAPDGLGYTIYPFGTRQSDWAHDLPLLAAIPPRAPTGAGPTPEEANP